MRRPGKNISEKTAFTLIEIILGLLILALIVGLAIPNFSRTYSGILLKQTAQDLAYLMRYAQARAVNKSLEVRLVIDNEKKSYWLEEKTEDNASAETQGFQKFSGRLGRMIEIANDISVAADSPTVKFYPDGSIERTRIYVCRKDKCFTVSTKEIRGQIGVYQDKI